MGQAGGLEILAKAFADSAEGGYWPADVDTDKPLTPEEFQLLRDFDTWSETSVDGYPDPRRLSDQQLQQAVDLMHTIELSYNDDGMLE